jgi:hypothetical protein
MMKRIKQLIALAIVGGIVYGLLSYHIVFYGSQVELLPKSGYTLDNTFVNVKPTEFRTPENILRNDALRDDGIGQLMVDFGVITQDELRKIEDKIRSGQ